MFRHSLLVFFNDASELSLLTREVLFDALLPLVGALPPTRGAVVQLLYMQSQTRSWHELYEF